MQIEHIEDWVGRTVIDSEGESVGKLEEVYFRGEEAVLAEVKLGLLARKRYLVPLGGATFTRDHIRLDYREDNLLHESSGGAGFESKDLAAVSEHYGAGCSYESNELESSKARIDRLATAAEARERATQLETEAEERRREAEAAREQSEAAEKAHQAAAQKAEAARAALSTRQT
jgi:sporulation protein YlmC with PRC-barrel domain